MILGPKALKLEALQAFQLLREIVCYCVLYIYLLDANHAVQRCQREHWKTQELQKQVERLRCKPVAAVAIAFLSPSVQELAR